MTTVQEPLTGPSFPSFLKSVIHDLAKIVIPSSDESHLIAANVSQQEQLRGVNKVGFSSVNKVKRERGAHSALRTPSRRISPKPSPHYKAELRAAKKSRTRDKEVELGCGAPALPELEALCGDLTTATNINRAVAQVFLLLAQGRISRRDALAFGSLARLLLRTVPGIRSEFVSAFGYSAWEADLKPKLTIRPGPSSRTHNVSEGSLSDRRTVREPSAQQDRQSPTSVQRAKEPVTVPAPNSQLPAPASPPTRPAPASNVTPPPNTTAVSPGPAPNRPPEIPPSIPAKIPDTRAAESVPNSESVTNKVPSASPRPAVAAPGITGPRLLWVERFQRFIPESAL